MKRCSTCNRTFTDENLSFCIDDGTPLVPVSDPPDDVTVVTPSSAQIHRDAPQTESYPPPDWNAQAYQPPGSYKPPGAPPGGPGKRKAWPWVLGILAVLIIAVVGLGIAAVILIPKVMRSASNRNATTNANQRSDNRNSNLSSNSSSNPSNLNENANAPESEVTAPPTDQDAVLNDLTNLEHEWTVANINADKKKLDRILAADYVGTDLNGKALGKAEYIEKIERDTTTQKWDFEDLKLALKGTRATLSGVVKFQTNEGELRYRFTDKFVWRDGRWQATGSEISRIT